MQEDIKLFCHGVSAVITTKFYIHQSSKMGFHPILLLLENVELLWLIVLCFTLPYEFPHNNLHVPHCVHSVMVEGFTSLRDVYVNHPIHLFNNVTLKLIFWLLCDLFLPCHQNGLSFLRDEVHICLSHFPSRVLHLCEQYI